MTAKEFMEYDSHSILLDKFQFAEAYHLKNVNTQLADDLIHNLKKARYSEDYIKGVLNAKRILIESLKLW